MRPSIIIHLALFIPFFPIYILYFLFYFVLVKRLDLNISKFGLILYSCAMLILVDLIVTLLMKKDVNLAAFDLNHQSLIAYAKSKQDDLPIYCIKDEYLVRTAFFDNKESPYLLIVCKPIDYYWSSIKQVNRYYKYYYLSKNGHFSFCGYRDNKINIGSNGEYLSVNTNKGVSGDCDNFLIDDYSDI